MISKLVFFLSTDYVKVSSYLSPFWIACSSGSKWNFMCIVIDQFFICDLESEDEE